MAIAQVLSIKGFEPTAEEFYTTADSVERATALLLENEEKVSTQDWLSWVAYQAGFNFDEEGFSFSIIDNGSADEPITYHYYVYA